MKLRLTHGISLIVAFVFVLQGSLHAAPAAGTTKITIPAMECKSCAKKVAAELSKVPGVVKVDTDVEATVAVITPRPQAVVSPRALWEAVERAGKKPMKLEGPSGSFASKPQS